MTKEQWILWIVCAVGCALSYIVGFQDGEKVGTKKAFNSLLDALNKFAKSQNSSGNNK